MNSSRSVGIILILMFLTVSLSNTAFAEGPLTLPLKSQLTSDSDYAYEVVKELSGDKYEGRRSGTPGYDKACDYTASEFKKFGLGYMKELDSYYQNYKYDMAYASGIPILNIGGIALKYMEDFRIAGYSSSSGGTMTFSKAVFTSYGYKEDYAGLDVSGQAAIILESDPSGRSSHLSSTDRIRIAKDKGAKAVIFIAENDFKTYGYNFIYPEKTNQGLPILYISPKSADKYWGFQLQQAKPQYIKSKLDIKVDLGYSPGTASRNVVGVLEGRDKNNIIIISAHLDGVGIVGGKVYPCANDNASGSSVVLALAKYFSSLETKPACTLVFALFGNEEEEMEGSRYFVEKSPYPQSSIIADINFDVCGAKGNPQVFVDQNFKMLHRAVNGAISETFLSADLHDKGSDIEALSGGSDFSSFKAKKIPFIYFCSGGGQYNHQIKDSIKDNIDRETLGNVVILARLSVENLAWKYTDTSVKYSASNLKKVFMDSVKHDMWMYETKYCKAYFTSSTLESAENILGDLDNIFEEVAFWVDGDLPKEKTKVYFTENNDDQFLLIGRSDKITTGGVSNWKVNGISCMIYGKTQTIASTSFPHELNHILTGILQNGKYGENIIEPYQEIEGRLVFLRYSNNSKNFFREDLKALKNIKSSEIDFGRYDLYKQGKFNLFTYFKQGGNLSEWYSRMGSLQQYIMMKYGKTKMREIYYKLVSDKNVRFADTIESKLGTDFEKLKEDWLKWLFAPVQEGNKNSNGGIVPVTSGVINTSGVLTFVDNGLKYKSIPYRKEFKSSGFELLDIGAASEDNDLYIRIKCKAKAAGDVTIFLQGDAPGLKETYTNSAVAGENTIVVKLAKQRVKSFTAGIAIFVSGNYIFIDKKTTEPWLK